MPVEWSREVYSAAGESHLASAQILVRNSEETNWALVFYLSGLSVECLLRSVGPRSEEHDTVHNLSTLLSEADLKAPISGEAASRDLNFVIAYWRGLHRFYAAKDLSRSLMDDDAFKREKARQASSPVEFAGRRCLRAAEIVYTLTNA